MPFREQLIYRPQKATWLIYNYITSLPWPAASVGEKVSMPSKQTIAEMPRLLLAGSCKAVRFREARAVDVIHNRAAHEATNDADIE